MTTEFDYQLNYGAGAEPDAPRSRPDAPLFASEDGMVASLSNSECIFQVRRTGETHVMTFQVLQALDQSREFRTLDGHVARIVATIPGLQSQRESVSRVLESLVGRGLLLSDADFLRRLRASAIPEPAPLRAIFIRACDRPAQLERLLASLADSERRCGANRHYVLLDDSRSRTAANRHRDLLREFARSTGCNLTYVGASERERIVGKLARAVPQSASILPWLLGGAADTGRFGGGRGWNLALLLSAGARLILLDDDHLLPLRRIEGARVGLDPNPQSPASTQFFRNLENALGAGEEVDEDPFQLHLDVAGHAFGAVTADSRYNVERTSLLGLALSRLDHLQGDARILATHQGAYGSSRAESGAWLYQLPSAERAEFVASRDAYLRNIETGSIWYGHKQACASASARFTPFALDNSVMLPCTNPTGRGEDALFSRVAELCHPGALTLELPVAIGHVQETQRKRSPFTMAALTPQFNYFLSDFVQRQLPDFHAEAPDQRLRLLAAHLQDIGAASESARTRQLVEYLAYARSDLIERLQHQFDGAQDAPVYWQADVRSVIEANGRALIAKNPPRLGEWPVDADAAACAKLLREETAQLATAYATWPSLWSYARDQGGQLLAAV